MNRKHLAFFCVLLLTLSILFQLGFNLTNQKVSAAPTSFPKGLVSITFDDNYKSQYTNALPKLTTHDLKSTLYVVTSDVGNTDYMTELDLLAFKNQGHEIASHTVNHPDLTTMNASQIDAELLNSKNWLENLYGPVYDFAYPYGAYNSTVTNEVSKYYISGREGYGNDTNTLSNFNANTIKVEQIGPNTTADQIKTWMDMARLEKSWIVLMYHEVSDTPNDPLYNVTPALFEQHTAQIESSIEEGGIASTTVKEAMDEVCPEVDCSVLNAPNGHATVSPSTQRKKYGDSASISISASYGYHVEAIIDNDVFKTVATPYVISSVTESHNVIVVTEPSNTNTIVAWAGPNGSINPSGAVTVSDGQSKKFTVTPNAHYKIDRVLVDGAVVTLAADNSYTFSNVRDDHTIVAYFTPITWTITATAGPNGSISPAGAVIVPEAGNQQFTIKPSAGYKIADVLVDGQTAGAVGTYTFTSVTANHTIVASFAIDTYTITASAGTGGIIDPTGAVPVVGLTNKTFTITPSPGYKIADVLVDGVSKGAVGTYTFTSVVANHTIVASFAIDTYTITASAGTGGIIDPTGAVPVAGLTDKAFTITPSPGYKIADVLVDGVSKGAVGTYTFTSVVANHTIVASFAIDTYTITASAGTGGIIDPTGAVPVAGLTDKAFTITPSPGYKIADVLVDGVSKGAVGTYTFTSVVANHTIVASFAIDTYTITASAGTGGIIDPTGAVPVAGLTDKAFTITPSPGYKIADVLVDGVSKGAVGTYTFTSVVANHTIVASFALKQYTIAATADPVAGGTITGTGVCTHGDNVQLHAVPGTGYRFVDWTEGGVEVSNTADYSFIAAGDRTLVAHFTLKQYVVTAIADPLAGGTVTGAGGYNHGESVNLSATTNTGYHFVNWTEGGVEVSTVADYSFTVTGDRALVAHFALNEYSVTASVSGGHGSVSPQSQKVIHGNDTTINITPDAGYHVASIVDTGDTAPGPYGDTYTLNNVVVDRDVVVTFAINEYTIQISASPAAGGTISGGGSCKHGDQMLVKAQANKGYHFVNWTEDGKEVSTDSEYSFTATGDRTLVAYFKVGMDSKGFSTFYFAEGYTGAGFEEWLCLMNPNAAATTAHIKYMFTDGTTQNQDVPIGGTTRQTVNVNGVVGPNKNVSIQITSDDPIVAERPMYFNYQGKWSGGHDVVGATSPQSSSYFAEGYTGAGFEEWLCLMNPNAAATTAHIKYMFTDGTTQNQDVPIGGTTRQTVNVNGVVGPNKNVSIQITSDDPIVAERPMYFNYQGKWSGGHDVVGATSPQSSSYFAEGYTGAGFEEWLCLMNPNAAATTAHIKYMFTDGTTQNQDVPIGGTTRQTVNVNGVVGPNKNVSIQITSDDPIVAERPMYFNYQGKWSGGHDVVGATSPQSSSYFAEGYTGAGFEEWLCLMNPNAAATTAHIKYMFTDGTTQNQDVPIGGTTRQTVNVNGVVGPNKNVSIQITSDDPIVAERPMYFNYQGKWSGGHDVVGYTP